MKRKTIVINRLTIINLPILLIINKLRNYEIYYIEKSSFFNNMNKITVLHNYQIKWIKKEYKRFSDYVKSQFLALKFADIIHDKTRKSDLYGIINDLLFVKSENIKKVDVAFKYYLNRVISPFAEQYAAAEYLWSTGKYSIIWLISFHSFAYFLKDTLNKNIRITILPGLFFSKIINILYNRLFYAIQKSWSYMSHTKKERIKEADIQQEIYQKPELSPEKYAVIYFPHQGIFYGGMFKKDHFYSNDHNSSFYKSNILHISLGEKNEQYMQDSYRYYSDNHIPYVDVYDLNYDIRELRNSLLTLLSSMNFKLFADVYKYGPWYIIFAAYLFVKVKKYYLIFSKFKKLKIALAGYEYLFPKPLAIALTLLDVKICASEERFIIAFYPDNYLILDYYFVASDIVKKPCLKTSQIDHFMPIGLVRVDDIFRYDKLQIYDEKYDTIKKTKKLIIALDFYLPTNDIDDTTRLAAKAWETIQFYKDLLKLANEFPSLHIVIKGKEADSYKSHYITDLVEVINRTENMEIELNYTRYNPYFIGEKADLTIACHTSLCDELLAAGRKVIIYEITDRLDTLFNYNKLPIIADSYESLKYHVQNFINGIYLYKDTIEKIKKEFYSDCYHGNVAKNIRSELEKIIAG